MADFRGTIFDFDGVLVDSPHEQARREGLRQLMEKAWSDIRGQTAYAPERFTPEVYQRIMSGKPRYAGALPVLQHFDAVGDSYLEAAARSRSPVAALVDRHTRQLDDQSFGHTARLRVIWIAPVRHL
jgi:beta-phosphoglucomutase